ncbi:glycosyltransferase [Candidatus Roizmanbacteria bacterium]|nr:glycosyltransferase [Candidatus Roizmanbacteria bacterium]
MINPKISIVIGTLNRPYIVISLINQLKNIPNIEVLIFDQSEKKNFQLLKKKFPKDPRFVLFRLESPNACKFLNLGWKKAKAPIVLYLDDDVEITEETISAHLQTYENPDVKAIAGRVINDGETVEESETFVGKIQWYGAIIHKNFSSKIKTYADFPYGCNMSYRKDALVEMEGFDKDLQPPIYSYNEVDLGYRINKKWPKSFLFEPEALVYHHRFPSGGGRSFDNKTLVVNNSFNYGYFISKNFSFFENLLWFLRRGPFQIMKEPNQIIPILKGWLFGKKKRFSFYTTFIFLIFTLSFFLRFWKVPEHFFFGIDEEYQSLLALSIVKHFHVIWIGLSAANTGFYIAPGLVYLHSLLLWTSRLDPIILGYAASIISFFTVVIFYFIIKHFFGKKTSLIATVIYSFSPFILSYDRRFWNSTLVPLTTILFFLSLVKSEKKPRWYILTAILLGLSFHIHASLFIFIPITISVLLYRSIVKKQKISIIYHLSSSISFLLIYSPLIVFDLVHNFDNLKTPFRMIKGIGSNGGFSFLTHIHDVQKIISQFWFFSLNPVIYQLSSIISFFILLWFFFKKKNSIEKMLVFIAGTYLFMFLFYPGAILGYYFLGFFPFFALIVSLFLSRYFVKVSFFILSLFAIVNIYWISQFPQNEGLSAKKELITRTISVLGNSTFFLDTSQNYLFFGGWRYLFEAYGKKPSSSQADQMFGWIYQKEVSKEKPQLKVIISTSDLVVTQPLIKKLSTGQYRSYIVQNE